MKWRCKSNGVVIELEDRETEGMRAHDGYEEYKEPEQKKAKKKAKKK